jgi:purine-binding chemotaxis protein CheW
MGTDLGDSMLVCRIARRAYALPLALVAETMRPLPIETVAGAPALVLGLSVIRGEPVPVLDAGLLVSGTANPVAPERFVVLKLGERRAAAGVDRVEGIRTIARDRLGELPPLLGQRGGAIEAAGNLDGELLFVLGAIRSVPESVWTALQGAR